MALLATTDASVPLVVGGRSHRVAAFIEGELARPDYAFVVRGLMTAVDAQVDATRRSRELPPMRSMSLSWIAEAVAWTRSDLGLNLLGPWQDRNGDTLDLDRLIAAEISLFEYLKQSDSSLDSSEFAAHLAGMLIRIAWLGSRSNAPGAWVERMSTLGIQIVEAAFADLNLRSLSSAEALLSTVHFLEIVRCEPLWTGMNSSRVSRLLREAKVMEVGVARELSELRDIPLSLGTHAIHALKLGGGKSSKPDGVRACISV